MHMSMTLAGPLRESEAGWASLLRLLSLSSRNAAAGETLRLLLGVAAAGISDAVTVVALEAVQHCLTRLALGTNAPAAAPSADSKVS